jgi:chaperonin cofactor prefoldin
MSRQVRDKEEELENSLTKIDTLRQDIRKAEKLRRELELRAEEAGISLSFFMFYNTTNKPFHSGFVCAIRDWSIF